MSFLIKYEHIDHTGETKLYFCSYIGTRIYFLINYFRFLKKKGKKAGGIGDRKRFRVDEFWEKIGVVET